MAEDIRQPEKQTIVFKNSEPLWVSLNVEKLFIFFFNFFLSVFEDNDLLFWLPDVLCQPTEVVLWSLLSVEMFF